MSKNLLQLMRTRSSNEMGKTICISIMSLEKHVRGDDFADESSHKTKICTEADIGNISLSCLLIAECKQCLLFYARQDLCQLGRNTECSFRARYENEACSPHVISFFLLLSSSRSPILFLTRLSWSVPFVDRFTYITY